MKKNYIIPVVNCTALDALSMLCASGSRPANAINFNFDAAGDSWHAD